MMKLALLALLVTAACTGESNRATIGGFSFEAPAGWEHHDSTDRGAIASEWTPDDNTRKESVTIILTERSPVVASTDDGSLERLLGQAQTGLHGHATEPTPVKTPFDLRGARVEVDYVPPGMSARYHRVHVVLASGTVLIHFLYTAKDPDATLEAFNHVVSSFHRGEG